MRHNRKSLKIISGYMAVKLCFTGSLRTITIKIFNVKAGQGREFFTHDGVLRCYILAKSRQKTHLVDFKGM